MSEATLDETRPHISLSGYYYLVRGNADFRRLWLAQIVSELGDWFYSVAIYDLVLRLTGSAQLVGAAVLLQVLPMFFLGPTAGAVNDRVSRRASMIVADLARAAVVLAMIVVQTREQIWLLYVLLGLEVATAAFFEPARNAVIAKVGAGGQVCLYTLAPVHLVVDVNGYFPAGTSYVSLTPARILDSREAAAL